MNSLHISINTIHTSLMLSQVSQQSQRPLLYNIAHVTNDIAMI